MSSRLKGIIAGSAVILLLVGALIVLKMTAPKESEDTAEESTTAASELSSLLYDKNPHDIKTLTIENQYGTYKIERLSNSSYTIIDYLLVPLDSSVFEAMLTNAASVTVQQTVNENADDLSIYGLAEPRAAVTAEFDDSKNTVKELLIGNDTPEAGEVYFCFKGEKKVYTINSAVVSNYLEDKTICLQKTVFSQAAAKDENDTTNYRKINSMLIKRDDLDYEIEIKYDDRADNKDAVTGNMSLYRLTKPVMLDLDADKSTAVVEGVFGLMASQIAAVMPEKEQLEEYGLADPFAEITMDTASGQFSMKVGSKYTDADGKQTGYYCYVNGIDIVYVFDKAVLPWVTVKPEDITTSLITTNYVYTVSAIDIKTAGGETHFTMTGNAEDNFAVKLDGKDMSADLFKSFYQFILSAPANEIYLEDTDTEPSLTVTIKHASGTDTIEFIPSADRKCIVKLNGAVSFRCSAAYAERLASNLELVKTGENIITTW